MSALRLNAVVALFGAALGFTLSRLGFADYGEVHRMFTFADPRLLLTFGGAVAVAMAGFALLGRKGELPLRPIRRGTLAGALLFGIGWAITGACPGAAIVQLGEGRLPALLTLGGIFAGTALHRFVQARYLRWDSGSCSDP